MQRLGGYKKGKRLEEKRTQSEEIYKLENDIWYDYLDAFVEKQCSEDHILWKNREMVLSKDKTQYTENKKFNLANTTRREVIGRMKEIARSYYNELAIKDFEEEMQGQNSSDTKSEKFKKGAKKIGKGAIITAASIGAVYGLSKIPGVGAVARFASLGVAGVKAFSMKRKIEKKYKERLKTIKENENLPEDLKLLLADELNATIDNDPGIQELKINKVPAETEQDKKREKLNENVKNVQKIMDKRMNRLEKKTWWRKVKTIFNGKDVVESPLGLSSLALISRMTVRNFTNSGLVTGGAIGVLMGSISASEKDWQKAIVELKKEVKGYLGEGEKADPQVKKAIEKNNNTLIGKLTADETKNLLRYLDSSKLARKEPILYRQIGILVKNNVKKVEDFDDFMEEKSTEKGYENYFEAKAYGVEVNAFRNQFQKILTRTKSVVTSVDETGKRKLDTSKVKTILVQGAIGAIAGLVIDKTLQTVEGFQGHQESTAEETIADFDNRIEEIDQQILDTENGLLDTDGDGLPDNYEKNVLGTNPNSVDSDSDGIADNRELELKTDPLNGDSHSVTIQNEDAPIEKSEATQRYNIEFKENGPTDNHYRSIRTVVMHDYADELGIDPDNMSDQDYAKVLYVTDHIADHDINALGDGTNLNNLTGRVEGFNIPTSNIDNAISDVENHLQSNPNFLDNIAEKYVDKVNWTPFNDMAKLDDSFQNTVIETQGDFVPSQDVETWQAGQTELLENLQNTRDELNNNLTDMTDKGLTSQMQTSSKMSLKGIVTTVGVGVAAALGVFGIAKWKNKRQNRKDKVDIKKYEDGDSIVDDFNTLEKSISTNKKRKTDLIQGFLEYAPTAGFVVTNNVVTISGAFRIDLSSDNYEDNWEELRKAIEYLNINKEKEIPEIERALGNILFYEKFEDIINSYDEEIGGIKKKDVEVVVENNIKRLEKDKLLRSNELERLTKEKLGFDEKIILLKTIIKRVLKENPKPEINEEPITSKAKTNLVVNEVEEVSYKKILQLFRYYKVKKINIDVLTGVIKQISDNLKKDDYLFEDEYENLTQDHLNVIDGDTKVSLQDKMELLAIVMKRKEQMDIGNIIDIDPEDEKNTIIQALHYLAVDLKDKDKLREFIELHLDAIETYEIEIPLMSEVEGYNNNELFPEKKENAAWKEIKKRFLEIDGMRNLFKKSKQKTLIDEVLHLAEGDMSGTNKRIKLKTNDLRDLSNGGTTQDKWFVLKNILTTIP